MSESTDAGDAVSPDDLTITSYEVPVEIRLDAYNDFEKLLNDVRATAANTILDHVDAFWRDDDEAHDHVVAKVDLDVVHAEHVFNLGEADVIRVETVTQLGSVEPGDD